MTPEAERDLLPTLLRDALALLAAIHQNHRAWISLYPEQQVALLQLGTRLQAEQIYLPRLRAANDGVPQATSARP